MTKTKKICLDDSSWKSLHINRSTPFTLYEILRPCKLFPDGVFFGSLMSSKEGYQELMIHNLHNLFQFTQVVEDELVEIDSISYLKGNFFLRRSDAVKDCKNVIKEGKVVGYCFNGISFHRGDEKEIIKHFAEKIYLPLVIEKKEWKELQTYRYEEVYTNDKFFSLLLSYLLK